MIKYRILRVVLVLYLGVAVAVAGALVPTPALAQRDVIEQGDKGLINWSQSYVEATGIGAPPDQMPGPAARPMAVRAAKADALRNLLEMVKGVRVDSETTVDNFVMKSDVIRSRVEGIVKGAMQVGGPRYQSDGTVELTLRMPLGGDLTQVMLEQVRGEAPKAGTRVPGYQPGAMGAESFDDVLRRIQREKEEQDRRRKEADADLRRIDSERREAEEARMAAERRRREDEDRLRRAKDDDDRKVFEARLAEQRAKEQEERDHLAALDAERKKAEADRAAADAERQRLVAEQKAAQQQAAAQGQSTQQAGAAASSSAPSNAAGAAGSPAAAGAAGAGSSSAAPVAAAGAAAGAVVAVTAMNAKNEKVNASQDHPWTGLIIDARGAGVKPSLVPKILSEDGTVVYGAQSVGFDDAVQKGLVGYARDVPAAVKHLRVTDDPILVQGAKAYGAKNSDVVLRAGDAKVVQQTDRGSGYLGKGRVMIVYN